MADAKPHSTTKRKQTLSEQNQANPSKFFSHFLYKAAIVTVFLVIIPLFPSQAPDFVNQTLLTRSWELLHLVFVGIAVSYGLFSRRNDDSEKENNTHNSKFDNAQSYVSRFLQVSSVFDDEAESPSGSSDENSKVVQTWSSQYFRNEPPMVVVAQEKGTTSSRIGEKPLLLPVRSLKSRVLDPDSSQTGTGSSPKFPNLGSKKFSNLSNLGNRELKGFDQNELEEKFKENLVLPSPIPWRSRSGRLEMKEEVEEEPESRSARTQLTRSSSRPNSAASSPKLSPSSPSISAESQAKSVEDFVRKKSFNKKLSSPPPAPPPPPPSPPPMLPKSQSFQSATRSSSSREFDDERDLRRSFSISSPLRDSNKSSRVNSSGVEVRPRSHLDVLPLGKSVRTIKSGSTETAKAAAAKGRENGENGKAENNGSPKKKTVRFDQTCLRTEKPSRETISYMPQPTFPSEYPKEGKKKQYIDKVIVESDDDDDSDVNRANSGDEEASSRNESDGGPDVDKKADEFIAKFREQIRLQRIESIKRSSGQMNRISSG